MIAPGACLLCRWAVPVGLEADPSQVFGFCGEPRAAAPSGGPGMPCTIERAEPTHGGVRYRPSCGPRGDWWVGRRPE